MGVSRTQQDRYSRSIRTGVAAISVAIVLVSASPAPAHEADHGSATYEVTAPLTLAAGQKRLRLRVLDAETDRDTAARFSVELDGATYIPEALGPGGLRFVSIHAGKQQQFVALYARGHDAVELPLPPSARRVVVQVAKGFEYVPADVTGVVTGLVSELTVRLRRWSDARARGWIPVEEHVHYDRLDPRHDRDWLDILAGDDLAQAHFLVLKGGNLPGIWAGQHAYGAAGEAASEQSLIRPGEEYRDNLQGHINLLGIGGILEPVLTGPPASPHNWPAFFDVLGNARKLGAIVGPAHGGELGLSSTSVADTILGRTDFFEIANTNRYKWDLWYRLLSCGFFVPPVAGTDLPNYPSRSSWQPLLGEVRTYVRTGGSHTFDAFRAALGRGETFITSGPLIRLTVAGVGPGGTVRLPAGGGDVEVEAELSSPRELRTFELVRQGEPVALAIERTEAEAVHTWRIRTTLHITESNWLAARGAGELKQALRQEANIDLPAIAHTAPIRILVGDRPILSARDAEALVDHLENQIALYRQAGKYANATDRSEALRHFEDAVRALKTRASAAR